MILQSPPSTPQRKLHFSPHSNFNISGSIKERISLKSPRASSRSISPSTAAITTTTISSPSNQFIKHCLKLRQSSSYRHLHGSVVVVGLTPIREILRFGELQEERVSILNCLLLLDGVEVPEELYNSSVRIVRVSSIVMKKLSGLQSIDSIEAVALMSIPSSFCSIDDNQEEANCQSWFPSPHRILVLDGIQDPGNLGTLLRTAMAFRWDGVFLLPGCCDPFNEKALRAARGASFQLPIISGNWVHLDALRKNFQINMLAGHPENTEGEKRTSVLSHKLVYSLADEHICLVLGSEGHGLSEKSKSVCELVSIQMAGMFESLNVSVAGGIFLFMLQPEHQRAI
ncbi:tRNA/rRNA methyltransferase [Cinnamomum micranthum f. kanehirae]|uniref:tRNA/rRNA methyltransferase n=1 Tax=Cinnamomum micranthum f. kanehirae TaxID=337451 RepID=A0A3S3N7D4_9MAGN|nr:tRNA/rRNA methyltransferase [Cinnamomum micranthum f. kanehirae]